MDTRTLFDRLLSYRPEIYGLLSELTVEIYSWCTSKGLSPRSLQDELRRDLLRNKENDPRKHFHIFNAGLIPFHSEPDKIRLTQLQGKCYHVSKSFPDREISDKVRAISSTANTVTESGNYQAHTNEIDNGPLLVLAATLLRLREVVSNDLYTQHEQIWDHAAQIFSPTFDFADIYGIATESENNNSQVAKSAALENSDVVNAKKGNGERTTLKLDNEQKILARLSQLFGRLNDFENSQRALVDIGRANTAALDSQINRLNNDLKFIATNVSGLKNVVEGNFKNIPEKIIQSQKILENLDKGLLEKRLSPEPREYPTPSDEDFKEMEGRRNELEAISITLEEATAPIEPQMQIEKPSINIGQATTKLLQMRNRIRNQNPDLENWENILQRPIVNVMVRDKPKTIDDWINLPGINQRYKKHQVDMDKQLNEFWEEIEAILKQLSSSD